MLTVSTVIIFEKNVKHAQSSLKVLYLVKQLLLYMLMNIFHRKMFSFGERQKITNL